ncbi:MAG: hypothetical protein RIB98_01965 [Acidimicrobiales bacterium]
MLREKLTTALVVALLASSCTAWTWGNRYDQGPSTPAEETAGWLSTSASAFNTCRIAVDFGLWCHGENRFGEVGDGTGVATDDFVRIGTDTWLDVNTTAASTCGVKTDRTLWCWGVINDGTYPPDPADLVLSPQPRSNTTDWATVGGSQESLCGTKVDGSLWCWGANTTYQLGDGTRDYRPDPVLISDARWISVDSGYRASCGVQNDHTLWCWGVDVSGETGQGPGPEVEYPVPTQVGSSTDWREVSLADSYACATRIDNSLWCWGSLLFTNEIFAEIPTRVGADSAWRTVDTGPSSACGIQQDNSMWCWGKNDRGRVGDGTTDFQPEPVQVGHGRTWIAVSLFWTVDALALDSTTPGAGSASN